MAAKNVFGGNYFTFADEFLARKRGVGEVIDWRIPSVKREIENIVTRNSYNLSSFDYDASCPISYRKLSHRPHACRTSIKKFTILFQSPKLFSNLSFNIKTEHENT